MASVILHTYGKQIRPRKHKREMRIRKRPVVILIDGSEVETNWINPLRHEQMR